MAASGLTVAVTNMLATVSVSGLQFYTLKGNESDEHCR